MLLSALKKSKLYSEVLFFSPIFEIQKHQPEQITPELREYMEQIIRHVETFSQIKWEIEHIKDDPFVLVYYHKS